jgi:hypothetical protein
MSRFVLFAFAHLRTNRAMTLQGLSVCYIYLMPCGEVIHGKKITYTATNTAVVNRMTVFMVWQRYLLHGKMVVM